MSQKRFILIDSHALIYRAFFAFPPLTSPDGLLVNAVYGYTRILLGVIRDLEPSYIAAAFDLPKPTFRHTEFVGYKAQRKEMPAELQGQIELVKNIIEVLNIPLFAVEGYEADDVIGTLARQIPEAHADTDVLIVTGDKDSFQLVTDRVHIWMPVSGKQTSSSEFGPADVQVKMGVKPSQIIDFKALAGDASDNIPGVKGIGEKTAIKLIQEFGSVDGIYEAINSQSDSAKNSPTLKGATLKKIAEGYESAMMSKKLATIDQHVPIEIDLKTCRVSGYDKEAAVKLLENLGFKSLVKSLPLDDFEQDVINNLI